MSAPASLFFTLPAERTRPFLARLESFRLRYQRRLHGWGRGAHVSSRAGSGIEFREFRKYAQGDDVRSIDWKTTARFARPYVRTFQHEENRFVHFVLDASASMVRWPQDRKADYARDLALALGYLALYSDDPAEFSVYPPQPGRTSRLECTSRARLGEVRDFLAVMPTGGVLGLDAAAASVVRENRGRHGTVIILSDFLYPEERYREALRRLVGRGLQVAAIHIRGRTELSLPEAAESVIEVQDAETGQLKRIAIDDHTRRLYQQAMAAHQQRLRALCQSLRIWYSEFTSPETNPESYLEEFTLQQLPGMGFLRSKT